MLVGRKKKAQLDLEIEQVATRVRFEILRELKNIAKRDGLTVVHMARKYIERGVESDRDHRRQRDD